jgi:hypothetical protein
MNLKNSSLKFAFALILCSSVMSLKGQSRAVVNQSVQWTSFNSNIKLHNSYGLTIDGQFRFAEFGNMQHQLRAGFEVYLSKKFSFVPLHYSYIWNYQYGKQPASFANNEHRIGQQITFKNNFSRLNFNHRLRFEERFIQVHNKNISGEVINGGYTNTQFRVRYRAMVNIPLNHQTITAKTLYLSIWDEIFISRGQIITYNDPDQNRIFAGPGYQVSKDLAIQAGFFKQLLIKANGTKQENNTGMLFQVNYNFDLTKNNQ